MMFKLMPLLLLFVVVSLESAPLGECRPILPPYLAPFLFAGNVRHANVGRLSTVVGNHEALERIRRWIRTLILVFFTATIAIAIATSASRRRRQHRSSPIGTTRKCGGSPSRSFRVDRLGGMSSLTMMDGSFAMSHRLGGLGSYRPRDYRRSTDFSSITSRKSDHGWEDCYGNSLLLHHFHQSFLLVLVVIFLRIVHVHRLLPLHSRSQCSTTSLLYLDDCCCCCRGYCCRSCGQRSRCCRSSGVSKVRYDIIVSFYLRR
mmetsp:Transcript_21397/g.47791  ORF Transcript_21397/g.47791 Transcript_21397/m.47791 type:complete len:260 (-) Transcript_21397:1060-1839(-)